MKTTYSNNYNILFDEKSTMNTPIQYDLNEIMDNVSNDLHVQHISKNNQKYTINTYIYESSTPLSALTSPKVCHSPISPNHDIDTRTNDDDNNDNDLENSIKVNVQEDYSIFSARFYDRINEYLEKEDMYIVDPSDYHQAKARTNITLNLNEGFCMRRSNTLRNMNISLFQVACNDKASELLKRCFSDKQHDKKVEEDYQLKSGYECESRKPEEIKNTFQIMESSLFKRRFKRTVSSTNNSTATDNTMTTSATSISTITTTATTITNTTLNTENSFYYEHETLSTPSKNLTKSLPCKSNIQEFEEKEEENLVKKIRPINLTLLGYKKSMDIKPIEIVDNDYILSNHASVKKIKGISDEKNLLCCEEIMPRDKANNHHGLNQASILNGLHKKSLGKTDEIEY